MKKILLLLTLMFHYIYAEVVINDYYKYELFNYKLDNLPEILTYDLVEKELEKQYGFILMNKVYDIETDKKFFRNNNELIGDVLNLLIKEYEVSVSIDEKKGWIILDELYSNYIKLPFGWNIEETIKDFNFTYPHVEFKINGSKLYVYGSKKDVEEVFPVMQEVEYYANLKLEFYLSIYPYSTNETTKNFIGYMKSNNLVQLNKPMTTVKMTLGHNDTFAFVFKDQLIQIHYDAIQESLFFDKDLPIHINRLHDLGYVFTDSKNKKYIIYVKQNLIM